MTVNLENIVKDLETITGRTWALETLLDCMENDDQKSPHRDIPVIATRTGRTYFGECDIINSSMDGGTSITIYPPEKGALIGGRAIMMAMLENTRLGNIFCFKDNVLRGGFTTLPDNEKTTYYPREYKGICSIHIEDLSKKLTKQIAWEALVTRTLTLLGKTPIDTHNTWFDMPYTQEEIDSIPALIENRFEKMDLCHRHLQIIKPWQIPEIFGNSDER